VKKLIATASGADGGMHDLMVSLGGASPQFFADEALRTEVNQSIPSVRRYLKEVGQLPIYSSYPAPAVGGPIVKLDLLENIFVEDIWTHGRHPGLLLDNIDRAIGAYKDLLASGETITQRDVQSGFTLVSSFQQHLRPMMRESPKHEREVQDRVEDLLSVRDVPHSREAEQFQYSSKSYRPDFVLTESRTALEVKLSKPGNVPQIIAEINDDIVAYLTHYRQALFIVYDLGGIRDEARFRKDLQANGKVVVIVVKH
jgi:hypothetical protein